MATKASMSGLDFSKEGTNLGFFVKDMTGVTFDADIILFQTAQAAVQGVSLIAFLGAIYPGLDEARENAAPASSNAQRELKWNVTLLDTVTQKLSRFEIGGADTTLLIANTDLMDLSAGAGLTLKTDLESSIISVDNNAITVEEARLVGRNI